MSDTPNRQSTILDNELDHSIQEDEPQDFNRRSDVEKFQFQQQATHQHNFQEKETAGNLMRDSHFQQDGVFSYNDDYRLRQSMKSEQDFELEDVNGNADMSDINTQVATKVQQEIKILQTYKQKPQDECKLQIKQQQSNSPPQVTKLRSKQNKQNPTKSTSQVPSEQVKLQQVKPNSPKYQPQKKKTQAVEKENIPSPPKKSIQKTQWSLKSNKSYSPMPEEDIYQSSKKKNQEESIKQEWQEPKIPFLKENLTLLSVKQPPTQPPTQTTTVSSIRDWFKSNTKPSPPSVVHQQTPQKQPQPSSKMHNKQQDAKQVYRKQMQAQMQVVQKSFTQHQKASQLFGKLSDKQKQKQKINKTHLPQPSSKKYIGMQSQQTDTEQYRMLLKISFQKKKQNYQMLKQWDKRRAQNMNLHKNMIQLLQNQVDKRIKTSLQNYQIYTVFLKQKLKQEEKFVTSPVINTKYALQNNSISKNIYINCSVILNSLSQENQARCNKIQDFISLIKNNILKDLTEHHLYQSQRQLLKVREKISTLKNSLKKYNSQTEEKSQTLAGLFAESANNVSMSSQDDFYSVQLQFLRCAGQQILIQKKLGQNCLQYYHTALNQELKRAKVIKEALLTYSKGLQQTYNINLEEAELEQLSKSQEVKLIQEFYSLEDMFDQRNSNLLKQKFKIPEDQDLSIKHVTKYVESFEFQSYSNRMLLLKEFQTKYYGVRNSKDSNSPREQTCYIVITVDFFIHLFFSCEKTSVNFKPDVSLKIAAKQLQIRPQKQQFIDIVKKQQKKGSMISYFWDSKDQKSYRVKFASKDGKQEFCDYVIKLMS